VANLPTIFLTTSLFIATTWTGCASSPKVDSVRTEAGAKVRDGSSYELAIQISARSQEEGLIAEHEWINQNHPDARHVESIPASEGKDELIVFSHRTDVHDGKIYSIYTRQLSDGSLRDFFFDQTAYFGKTPVSLQAAPSKH
jgi:hypothetical protein